MRWFVLMKLRGWAPKVQDTNQPFVSPLLMWEYHKLQMCIIEASYRARIPGSSGYYLSEHGGNRHVAPGPSTITSHLV